MKPAPMNSGKLSTARDAPRRSEHDGRDPSREDHRTHRQGGRRASDLVAAAASFVYTLLTEAPH
jgi:hypothetical protein